MAQINYYEVLGVPRSASQEEIRAAYRRLAKVRHPDHPSGSARDFARLQEANAVLSDPNRRRQHNQDLDLAYAADQLSDLDFSSLEDELASKRRERESSGEPGLGERLKGRFRRKDPGEGETRGRQSSRRERSGRDRGGRNSDVGRSARGRYSGRTARWYEPQDFEPEGISFKTGALSFVGAFLAFLLVGQVGLWARGVVNPGQLVWLSNLAPYMPVLYALVGLVCAYFAYRAAGYWALALVFVAALVVGGQGGPTGLLQFATVGIVILLAVIYLGNRRSRTSRR